MTIENIVYQETFIVVKVPQTRTIIQRTFEDENMRVAQVYQLSTRRRKIIGYIFNYCYGRYYKVMGKGKIEK